jgi:hypothetical protein
LAGIIGSLRVNLGLDSAQFTRGAGRVEKPMRRMRRQFLAVSGAAAAMFGGIAAAALVGAQQIDETAKSARRLDASIGGFRALEIAASEAGVNLSGLTNDIQTMNRELSTIGTSGNGARALDALGLSISDLEGLDADEKLAVIADQVGKLGLDAGQTTAILRDLGVRNREMALLMLQGGDAIRAARSDVEDYGLAISDVDASSIELANDRIGRLGLIGQYAGQQLAVSLVPALGALAKGLTDSLREGGILRAVIDGLVGNLDRLTTYAVVAVSVFGVRYVAAMVAARIATFSFAGSLAVVRTAIMRTGVGLLIIGAAELVMWFLRLVEKAGGFGNALALLGDVAREVFDRIVLSFGLVPAAIRSGSAKMSEYFLHEMFQMAVGFRDFTQMVADGLNALFNSNLQGAGQGLVDSLGLASGRAGIAAHAAASEFDGLKSAIGAPLESLQALRDAMVGTADDAIDLSGSLGGVDDDLNDIGGAGGSAGAAAAGLGNVAGETDKARDSANEMKTAFSGAFDALLDRTKGVRGALSGLAMDFSKLFQTRAFEGIWNATNGFGTGAVSVVDTSGGAKASSGFAGFFDGGGHIPSGRFGIAGEYGAEIVRGPANVTSRIDTARMMRGSVGTQAAPTVNIYVSGASGDKQIRNMVEQGVSAGMAKIRTQVPGIMQEYNEVFG